ncbi:uncharacterized protein KY384_008604 [Bacidia gigantensis]|uniref:uncharacterized protein n=1 Tax=Bacidia gigantensis TaxID=2732470 RepID=UPI001D053436|nr:uncharacterized protein KY384_008604 [Bacidia gigantensis]KAG8527174.1 hypothetical protein KY384_008604 [Bacidia gigantensis]
MFSTTLRRRPSLSGLAPILQTSPAPKLFESSDLHTHDIAFPFNTKTQAQPTPGPSILVLLLTSSTLSPSRKPTTLDRVTRFSTLATSPAPLILFLLKPPSATTNATSRKEVENVSTTSDLCGFMELQTLIHEHLLHAPSILPVPAISDILPTLHTYTSSLAANLAMPPLPIPPPRQVALSLLQRMTTSPTGLSQHDTNVMSDICRSIEEVSALASSTAGRRELKGWLGEKVGGRYVPSGGTMEMRAWRKPERMKRT